jgi:hypothetical protein|tara:strand:+ start:341 stop:952 length:612 start_codon:yes stop_codon:yes gene_type:complete
MNKILIILMLTLIFSERVHYWNLGIAINKETKRTVQKIIDIDSYYADSAPYKKTKNTFSEEPVFTLQTNYLIEPESISIEQQVDPLNLKTPIKTLIVNEEYFSAAKQIVSLEDSQIFSEFYNMDDFYYWSSYVFYNLDNHEEALRNISMIANREHDPEMLFLEALILENLGEIKSSESILIQLISQFPNNDYSDYSRNILLEK